MPRRRVFRVALLAKVLVGGTALPLAGCAHELEILEPVGPAPIARVRPPVEGSLRVLTPGEWENDSDVFSYRHRDFDVYSPDGKRLPNGEIIGWRAKGSPAR